MYCCDISVSRKFYNQKELIYLLFFTSLQSKCLIVLGIRTYLLENDQECPTCGAEDVSPDSLIINKQLRQVCIPYIRFMSFSLLLLYSTFQAVNNFRNARPASPFVNSTTDKPTSDRSATSTVDSPAQVNDKISSPSINVTSPDVRSPDTRYEYTLYKVQIMLLQPLKLDNVFITVKKRNQKLLVQHQRFPAKVTLE